MSARYNASLWSRLGAEWLSVERRRLASDERLVRTGDPLDTVYFPLDAVIWVARHTPWDTAPLTVTLVGSEGLLGWQALLLAQAWSHDAITIAAGQVVCVSADALRAGCAKDPELNRTLLAVANFHTLQLAQNIVANLGHSVKRRLSRWLVMLDDRTVGDMLNIRHDQIARILNVRRATITDALHVLEGEHLIRNQRGQVQIRDREGLQAQAGQSYGLSEDLYVRTVGPFGKGSLRQQF